jgi:hypothetical protein
METSPGDTQASAYLNHAPWRTETEITALLVAKKYTNQHLSCPTQSPFWPNSFEFAASLLKAVCRVSGTSDSIYQGMTPLTANTNKLKHVCRQKGSTCVCLHACTQAFTTVASNAALRISGSATAGNVTLRGWSSMLVSDRSHCFCHTYWPTAACS